MEIPLVPGSHWILSNYAIGGRPPDFDNFLLFFFFLLLGYSSLLQCLINTHARIRRKLQQSAKQEKVSASFHIKPYTNIIPRPFHINIPLYITVSVCVIYMGYRFKNTTYESPVPGQPDIVRSTLDCRKQEPLIVNGENAEAKEFPHMVQNLRIHIKYRPYTHIKQCPLDRH